MAFKEYRAKNYNRLHWVNDDEYIKDIIKFSKFKKSDIVLDVGTGTGIIAHSIEPIVKQVIGIDISYKMLEEKIGSFPVIIWDIQHPLFANNIFDAIVARMSFHHIENTDNALKICYNYLKNKGKLIIAEGVPPQDDSHIVDWFTEMFKLKEKRHIFTTSGLLFNLNNVGFKNIEYKYNVIENFSINNWLNNSGLSKLVCKKIFDMHKNASNIIKETFNIRQVKNDILIKSTNIIIRGEKHV